MAGDKFIIAFVVIVFAWIPTGSECAPIEQNQIDIMAFTDQLEQLPLTENAEVENGLAKLLIELLSRAGIDHSNNLYQGMPSSEQYEDEFFGELKRGKTGRREGGRSNRRGSARSTTMHSTVGLGKRGGYKQVEEPYRPKPLLTWRH
ncbi:uncharacterized protein [Apostichopus japonicus]|uniref:uncharacterized protein n=1 Tax=Stichopus japonicus TaxID=307972 RepID=UPI003AB50D4F